MCVNTVSRVSPPPELLLKGSKEEQRDYVFYLAVGNYRLKVRRAAHTGRGSGALLEE